MVVKIILLQKVIIHSDKRSPFWSLIIFGYLSFTTVRGQKIGFNSCGCIKFLNIANINASDVWGKHILIWDNTNCKAGGLEGRVSKWKMWAVSRLHRRQKGGPMSCTKTWSGRLQKRVGWAAEKGSPLARPFPQPSLMCRTPPRLNVQPTGPSCSAACQPALLCSSPVCGKFMFFIW